MMHHNVGLFPDFPATDELKHSTGVLPSQIIRQLIATGRISSPIEIADDQIQPASIDLRLGPVGYRVRASFLPGRYSSVAKKVKDLQIAEIDLTKPTILEK